jgi:uncharacterized Zn-binding protein involved in type VI secretion
MILIAALAICGAAPKPSGRVVALTTQPGSKLESDAAKLVADDLASARRAHETPVMLVGSAHLSIHGGPAALFVQVQSASLCGSAGCSSSVFVKHGRGWTRVLDSVSGPVKVSPSIHQGMHDLLVHGTDRWVWNGSAYTDTLPAPQIDLK